MGHLGTDVGFCMHKRGVLLGKCLAFVEDIEHFIRGCGAFDGKG